LVVGIVGTSVGMVRALRAEAKAQVEARRAEAGKLVALAQLELDPDPAESNPSAALAYATASLEAFDTPEGRRIALAVLWKGPTALVPQVKQSWFALAFSPDGRWIAHHPHPKSWPGGWETAGTVPHGASNGTMLLQPADGGPAIPLQGSAIFPMWVQFDSTSRYLLVWGNCSSGALAAACPYTATVWSVPDGRILRTWSIEKSAPWTEFRLVGEEVRRVSYADGAFTVESAGLEEDGEPIRRRVSVAPDLNAWALNRDGTGAVYVAGEGAVPDFNESEPSGIFEMEGGELHFVSLDGSPSDLFVATWPSGRYKFTRGRLRNAAFDPAGDRFATATQDGTVRIWSISEPGAPVQVLQGRDRPSSVIFDRTGSRLMMVNLEGTAQIWDLDGTPGAAPLELHVRDAFEMYYASFDPTGRWAAVSDWTHGGPVLFPLDDRYPRVMHGHTGKVWRVAFSPDSRWATSCSHDGTIRIWPLSSDAGKPRVVLDNGTQWLDVEVSSDGRWILAHGSGGSRWVVPVDGGEPRELVVGAQTAGFSPDGRFVALQVDAEIRLWEVETGASELFEMPADKELTLLHMLSGRRLLMWESGKSAPEDSWIVLWSLDDGSLRYLWQPNELGLDDWSLSPDHSVTLDGRIMLALLVGEPMRVDGPRVLHFGVLDPETGDYRPLPSHPSHTVGGVMSARVDVTGTRLISYTHDGFLRVGPLADQEPHVLPGPDGAIMGAAISPDGRWIASAGEDRTVRLWPMPDLTKPPFHTLPHDELIAKLRALTNFRAVPDADALTGYRIDIDPFPGWETVPTW
jgi:WD40 repeat protein